MTIWETFSANTFCPLISDVSNFDQFNTKLRLIKDNKLKGDLLEYFSKLYFKLVSANKKKYMKYYLYDEIPDKIKKHTKLPSKDKGIDGLLIDYSGNMYAVQVKFRSDQKIIPFGELATFPALTFGTDVKHISGGVMVTNCFNVCDELKGGKYTNITFDCFAKCDSIFWTNARKYTSKQKLKKYVVLKPLSHQKNIFPLIEKHYTDNNNGRLYLPCGTGKTFIGYWSAIKVLQYERVFIVVPSLYLLSETYDTWIKESQYLKPGYDFTLIGSDINNRDECEYKPTTDIKTIKNNLETYDRHIVITTYQSCDLLLNACRKLGYRFDFGIFDEAHRTTGESDKIFTCLLTNRYKIAKKRLFMTATEKVYNYSKKELDEQILSMDNETIYGKVIYKYSTRQAINDEQLVDYKIVAPFISTDVYDALVKENKIVKVLRNKRNVNGDRKYEMKLILLCVTIKQAMDCCGFTHLLIFSNKNSKARIIYEILNELFNDKNMYLECLSGHNNMTVRRSEVAQFEKAKKGIISSARIFGEGVNIRICDSVCFADNKGSSIDIVQYVGRCLRKYELKPDKIGYVLIPFLIEKEYEDNFFTDENKSYFKLRRILKILGDTDDVITENFILIDCGAKIAVRNKNDSSIEQLSVVKVENQSLNLKTFAQHIVSKIFDRAGDSDSRIRNIIIHENHRRWIKKKDLIDTKHKCLTYLKNEGIEDNLPTVANWVKYCTGPKLFEEFKKIYYYDKNILLKSCHKLRIYSHDDYINKYASDPKLPPIDYINNGFYVDIDPKFNLQLLLHVDVDNDI